MQQYGNFRTVDSRFALIPQRRVDTEHLFNDDIPGVVVKYGNQLIQSGFLKPDVEFNLLQLGVTKSLLETTVDEMTSDLSRTLFLSEYVVGYKDRGEQRFVYNHYVGSFGMDGKFAYASDESNEGVVAFTHALHVTGELGDGPLEITVRGNYNPVTQQVSVSGKVEVVQEALKERITDVKFVGFMLRAFYKPQDAVDTVVASAPRTYQYGIRDTSSQSYSPDSLVPVLTEHNAAAFADEIEPIEIVHNEETIKTSFLKPGVELSLLAVSQTDLALARGYIDSTDVIDPNIMLKEIAISYTDPNGEKQLYVHKAVRDTTASFAYPPQSNYRQLQLNYVSYVRIGEGNIDVVKVKAFGHVNLELGDTRVDFEIHSDDVAACKDLKVIGYSLAGSRRNMNIHKRLPTA